MMARLLRLGALTFVGAAVACTGTVEGLGSGGSEPGNTGTGSSPGNKGTGGSGSGPGAGSGGNGNPTLPGSGGGGQVTTPIANPFDLTGAPNYHRFVRLTNEQWLNSVKDVLMLKAVPNVGVEFQAPVSGTTDFTNNELVLDVTSRVWSDVQQASEVVAAQVTSDAALLSGVYSGTDAAGFISAVGRRAYRRPLTSAEKSTYMTLFNAGANLTGTRSAFAKGASLVIRAMLQSPHFLYRSELGANGAPLTGYEVAAKLSLWLKNTTPNDALLDSAAGPGRLDTPDGAVAAASSMLNESATATVMRKFHGELFHLDRYRGITKEGVPTFKPALTTEFEESSYLFFDKIFTKGLGLKDVLLSTSGFVGPTMAGFYEGVTPPTSGYVERDLGSSRVGFFSQLPFLTLYAHNGGPDSIHRGVAIAVDVLCTKFGELPATVPPLPPQKAGQSNRQRVTEATAGCGLGCHQPMINPLGFAFEHYDGMGQYRQTEKSGTQELPIDSSGTFRFTDGEKSFNGVPELMQLLASSKQAHLCYSKKVASFGLQRDVIAADMPMLEALAQTSMSSTGSVKQIVLDLVKQNAFRTRVGGAQ